MAVVLTQVSKFSARSASCEVYGEDDVEAMANLRKRLEDFEVQKSRAVKALIDMSPVCDPLEAYGEGDSDALVALVTRMRHVVETQHAEITMLRTALKEALDGKAFSTPTALESTAAPSDANQPASGCESGHPFTSEMLLPLLFSSLYRSYAFMWVEDVYYIVRRQWLEQCALCCGAGMGPIDTTEIADGEAVGPCHGSRSGMVRLRPLPTGSVCAVPHSSWHKLVAWFGLKGPAISRRVFNDALQLDSHDISIYALEYSADASSYSVRRIAVLPYFDEEPTMTLVSDVAAMLGKDVGSIRIWDATLRSAPCVLYATHYAATITKNNLGADGAILAEPQCPYGTFARKWPDIANELASLKSEPASAISQ